MRSQLEQLPGWGDSDFRWRGGEVSRLEGLSDGVFALALALLFVSSDPPSTYLELSERIRDFPALLICIVFLMMPWWSHYKFFRRFGLQDLWTVTLNTALLFLVLFYVYPLEFLFTSLVDGIFGHATDAELNQRFAGSHNLMLVYGVGFIGIFGCLALLNVYGYRKRHEFELDELECYLTRTEIHGHLIMVAVGCASITVSKLHSHGFYSGITYGLIGPLQGIRGYVAGRQIERLRATRSVD